MDRADLAGDAAQLKAASDGGYDLVVDATGSAAVSEHCVPLTRNGGTVMFYGVTEPEDLVRVSPYDVFRCEITIKVLVRRDQFVPSRDRGPAHRPGPYRRTDYAPVPAG